MRLRMVFVAMAVLSGWGVVGAEIRLESCFGDHMVIQRDMPARVSGWAAQGAEVTVEFAGQKKEAKATGSNGWWRVTLDPMPANAVPQTMIVRAKLLNSDSCLLTSSITNVLVGDVWVCSGQSNMRMTVMKGPWCGYGGALNASNEVAAADHHGIRLYQNFNATNWNVCTPESAKTFSATGYFFARELHKQLKVPIGMAEGSMGGTEAESWAPREALFDAAEISVADKTFNELKPLADEDRKTMGAWKRDYDAAKKEGKPLPRQPAAKLSRDEAKRYDDAARIHYAGSNYSGFIAKYTAMTIKGVIWYQGESNRPRADQYAALMKRLIASWLKAWGQEFPFLVMQLVNFGQGPGKPQSAFPELRQAQQEIAYTVPNSGIAIGIDIGVANEIHPPNKQEVGRRLALVALKKVYEQDVVASGPVLKNATFGAGKVVLAFDPGGKDQKLVLKNSETNGFELAGAYGKFVPAVAKVKENIITLTAPDVSEPCMVRYAWYDDPPVSLFNSDGLPAAPFKRDR